MSKRLKEVPKLTDNIRKLAPELKGLRDIDIIEMCLREKVINLGGKI
jgi:hypothetical protein